MTARATARPATVDEYLASVSADKRAALEHLRASIHSLFPGVEECISYGMPGFRLDGKVVAWFAAAAKHCSFYPGGGVEDFRSELRAYEISTGTVRFRADQRLPKTIIRKLIQAHRARRQRAAGRPKRAPSGRGATGRTKPTGRPERGKINAAWHRDHRMPKPATLAQRVAWHRAHARHCGCRKAPASIRPYLDAKAG